MPAESRVRLDALGSSLELTTTSYTFAPSDYRIQIFGRWGEVAFLLGNQDLARIREWIDEQLKVEA